ncbi:MAG: NosD domain-containing protein [Promethearchaeota archaeon]
MSQYKLLITIFIIIIMIGTSDETNIRIKVETSELSDPVIPLEELQTKRGKIETKTPHDPILITSDSQFTELGFLGSGSMEDPYRIEGLEITATNGDLISINNTTVTFHIINNYLDGSTTASSGIRLSNVQHARIEKNLISNCEDGIRVSNTSEIICINNNITLNNKFGIFFERVINSNITSNVVQKNNGNGIHIKNSQTIRVSNNSIHDHQDGKHTQNNILLDHTSKTVITENELFKSIYGINLLNSAHDNTITNNTIQLNQKYGIRLEYASRNRLNYNNITDNQEYGILATLGSNDNSIQFNNFAGNNGGETQAVDDGNNNIFQYNYWDDQPLLDLDEDLIIDTSYQLDGKSNNTDPYPLAEYSPDAIENAQKSPDNLGIIIFLGILLVALGGSISGSYYLFRSREKKHEDESEEPFTELNTTEQIERIRPIYDKLVVGIENLQTRVLPQPITVPLLESAEPISLVEFFPSDIKDDLQSGMKWRTILTLIEIAYQDPSDTNPAKLAQSLDIAASTLSKEIKKLKELDYIESYVSSQVLRDGRYRNYTITQKGFNLLYTLKETLKVTITRLKEKEGTYYV